MLVKYLCSASVASLLRSLVPVYRQRTTGVPVQYLYSATGVLMWSQCSTSMVPVQYQCRAAECQCSADGVPAQDKNGARVVSMRCHFTTRVVPEQYPCRSAGAVQHKRGTHVMLLVQGQEPPNPDPGASTSADLLRTLRQATPSQPLRQVPSYGDLPDRSQG